MRGILDNMKQKILDRDYYLSSHAEEEMEDKIIRIITVYAIREEE